MLENGGQHYRNYSGCGNTLNGNHPIVREMIFHCLRHWVHNYHVDGFRFDLASILSRDREGNLVPNPPVVETIGEDPQLADSKIIAEAWDASGAYQVGHLRNLRWAEWNGRYRDDLRRFWRGDPQMIGPLATRAGRLQRPLPGQRPAALSQHQLITSHDGFTLNDLVTYGCKHNEANGEQSGDGDNNNYSANYGVEGPTTRRTIELVRLRQIKNMLTSLLLSQGVPMLHFGDECRRTQQGNNNATARQRHLLVRLAPGAEARATAPLLPGAGGIPQGRADRAADRFPDWPAGAAPGGLPDVSWLWPRRQRRGLVERLKQPVLPLWGRAAARRGRPAQPPRVDHVPCRQPTAGVCDSQGRRKSGLAAVRQHGGAQSAGHLSGPEWPAAGRRAGGIGGPLAHVFHRALTSRVARQIKSDRLGGMATLAWPCGVPVTCSRKR